MRAKLITKEYVRDSIMLKIGRLIANKRNKREGLALKDIFAHLEEGLASYLDILLSFDEEKEFKDDYYYYLASGLLLDIVATNFYSALQGSAFQQTESMVTDTTGKVTKKKGIKENHADAITKTINRVVLPNFFEGFNILRSKCNTVFFDGDPVICKELNQFMDKVLIDKETSESRVTAVIFALLAATEVFIDNVNSATTENAFLGAKHFYQKSCARAFYAVLDDCTEYTPPTPENEKLNIYKLAACFALTDIFITNLEVLSDTPRELVQALATKNYPPHDAQFNAHIPKPDPGTYFESIKQLLTSLIISLRERYNPSNVIT